MFTAYHAKYYAQELVLKHAADGVDRLSQALFDANVDLNPHQIEAALFALKSPLSKGVILADEVGLGKTIEAALVLGQYWAERKRRLLIIGPASLRKQWSQELRDKFNLRSLILDAPTLRKIGSGQSLDALCSRQILIMSYQFSLRMEVELRSVPWDLVVIDEAHKLRNAHRRTNRIGQALKRALAGRQKLLLTATPLQNSLLELYGLSTLIDEHQFGDETVFRRQYMQSGADLPALRARLQTFVQRSLRKDVLEYVKYTERKPLTQKFNPTDEEQQLYDAISVFLQNEVSYALPKKQRHLTALILRKLLASSAHAVVATLRTIRTRLVRLEECDETAGQDDLVVQLIADEDLEQDYLDDAEDDNGDGDDEHKPGGGTPDSIDVNRVRAEIAEIDSFIAAVGALTTDTKAQSLLHGLAAGMAKMVELKGPKKAIIFTESRRTQEYLAQFLAVHGYSGRIVTFSGSNNSEQATHIYHAWLARYKGTDRVTGSPQVDRRTALIDCFRDDADIMIATEAAAEGVNLQFCALVINYDLPWNPQRIEQRIGRCHRYGQRFDVVVMNFLNTRNYADQRVLELLTEKFSLFSGVFGASDEVLGTIESGIDFERRILQIVESCREPEQIEAAFNALQAELEQDINVRIRDTQTQLLERFDEDVHDRLKLRLNEAESRLDKVGRWFWGASRYILASHAQFDDAHYAFSLLRPPIASVAAGRYQLLRGALQPDMLAHAYRLTHPLGEWTLAQALAGATPPAEIIFEHSRHPSRISVLEPLRGTCGWLRLIRLRVTAFDVCERLMFIARTDSGSVLDQETCEKMLMLEAAAKPAGITASAPAWLDSNGQRRVEAEVAVILDTNQRLFHEERNKLEKWADDKLLAAEEHLRNTKQQIAQTKRDSRQALSMEEQAGIQVQLRALEQQQRKQRQEVFEVEDAVLEKRDALIAQLEQRLTQSVHAETLFSIRWWVQ
ncbi:ATP-dependent helicase [Janthinobacterium sp. BJB312]|uniref:SNF2-related protein n=1 Tax=Janthinobacterium sp. BJB401 TaxID=2745934 RepID=UPI000C106B08|nr:SNF2-related protein [Janthinobacterium sp. BJB401]NVI81372.1 DEAD/DEAH box helicase [Janthinobacterium sp. BJB401]PHV33690.1 ATP-dependent helicase [Janthinobacterium sp. BJB312]